MVWNASGSTLYKAVERHNNAETDTAPQPYKEPAPKPLPPKARTVSPLHSLAADRDILLIAAVLLILLHEKADTALILALAFVIFS